MKIIYLIGIVALLSAIMIMPVMAFEPGECNIEVHPSDSLDAKVDSATDGQTVCVYAGTYGWFSLNTPNVTLKGEGVDKVTLDCVGTMSAIGNAAPASGCIVDGFKIVNSDVGIDVDTGAPDCIIRNCVFEGLTGNFGVILGASNTTFMDNTITGATGTYSALHPRLSGSCVVNNTIVNNTGAILLYQSTSTNHIITKNNISSNGKGIWLYNAGSDNKIYLNDITDNTANVTYSGTSPTVTYWNSTEQIEYVYGGMPYTNYLGNYWSTDYTGTDADGDGIGDTAYDIPGSATDKDYRPLMAGYENYLGAPAGEEKPDLVPTEITTPASIFANESNSITATIANTGSGDAGAFNVSLSAEGTVVDRASVAGLGAGNSTEVSLEWTPAASGTYELCVVADCDGVIDESDETNNVTCRSVYATEPGTMEYTIKIDDYTLALYDGGEVIVPVEIQNASDIAGGSANITFNASVVNVKAVSAGHFGTPAANIDNTSGFVHVSAGRAFAVGREEAVLANLLFEGISEGYTALNVQNALLNFEDGNTTTPATIDGSIKVETWMLGDLNHNNMIDTGDATLVLRMVVGLVPTNMLGDMNHNGMIDTGDATLILRTVVGLPI